MRQMLKFHLSNESGNMAHKHNIWFWELIKVITNLLPLAVKCLNLAALKKIINFMNPEFSILLLLLTEWKPEYVQSQ